MSVKVTADGKTYTGVSSIAVGGKTLAVESEVSAPSGTKSITANGTYDVSAYAQAVVNVPTEGEAGGGDMLKEYRTTITGSSTLAVDGIDLTSAKMIFVQFRSQNPAREATNPAYAFYAGTLMYAPGLLDESFKDGTAITTTQGDKTAVQSFDGDLGKAFLGIYYSATGTVRNWGFSADITETRATFAIKSIGLEPTHTYDVIVKYL